MRNVKKMDMRQQTQLVDMHGLQYFEDLEECDLAFSGVRDISALGGVSNLAVLNISGCHNLTMEAIEVLKGCTNLKQLYIFDMNITVDQIESALKPQLPALDIIDAVASVNVAGITNQQACAEATTSSDHDNGKYTVHSLTSGKPADMARGLANFMGVDDVMAAKIAADGLQAIREEFEKHGDKEDIERMRYILDGAAEPLEEQGNEGKMKIRDNGHINVDGGGMRLDDFAAHANARAGKLQPKHVAALRIYTSKSFWRINSPLRKQQKPHPFPATTLLISQALSQLRAVHAPGTDAGDSSSEAVSGESSKPTTTNERVEFWRGMRDLKVTPEFMRFGGAELGCMSTSTDMETVASYAASKCPLIFKVVSTSWTNRGCDIKWLSLYPDEAEVLYPPLTYLKPISKSRINGTGGYLVEVQPEFPGA
jgi:hypothetical protein